MIVYLDILLLIRIVVDGSLKIIIAVNMFVGMISSYIVGTAIVTTGPTRSL